MNDIANKIAKMMMEKKKAPSVEIEVESESPEMEGICPNCAEKVKALLDEKAAAPAPELSE
jgi:hypothetical protein